MTDRNDVFDNTANWDVKQRTEEMRRRQNNNDTDHPDDNIELDTKISKDIFDVSYPFYHYKDYSRQPDVHVTTPLTQPGHVPNFPVKMHMILCRTDLCHIVSWLPHGRAWKVHKPKEFESIVLPIYFEHCKYRSFIRQVNGWGFRRLSKPPDKNCYYHEQFLRGLPHLCKELKRPRVAEKIMIDPNHEPNLYAISDIYPVPEQANDVTTMYTATNITDPTKFPANDQSNMPPIVLTTALSSFIVPTSNSNSTKIEFSPYGTNANEFINASTTQANNNVAPPTTNNYYATTKSGTSAIPKHTTNIHKKKPM